VEIVGSVAADEVPEGIRRERAPGIWKQLAERALADHKQGRVTVVKVADQKELTKLRANLAQPLRLHGYKARPLIVRQGGEMRVFLELAVHPTHGDLRLLEEEATPVNSRVEAAT